MAAIILAGHRQTLPEPSRRDLLAALRHADLSLRMRAARAADLVPGLARPLLEQLAEDLRSGEGSVRRDATLILANAMAPSAERLRLLAGALESDDSFVAGNFYEALKRELAADDFVARRYPFDLLVNQTRADRSDVAERAVKLLKKAPNLPDSVHEALAESFTEGRPQTWRERALAIWRESAASPPESVRKLLLAVVQAQPDGPPRQRLLAVLERWFSLDELLPVLHPAATIARLTSLVPRIGSIPTAGLTTSPLADERSLAEFLTILEELKDSSDPRDFRELMDSIGTIADLKKIVSATLLRPAYTDLAVPSGHHLQPPLNVPYHVPGLDGERHDHEAAFAEIDPGTVSEESKALLLRTFETFDALIDSNFQALDLLARGAGSLDKATARKLLGHAGRMAEALDGLYAVKQGRTAPDVSEKFAEIRDQLESLWAGLPEHGVLPDQVARRVADMEPEASLYQLCNLHTLINYMHQKSFDVLASISGKVNADGTLRRGGRTLHFLHLGSRPLLENRRLADPFLSLLGQEGIPEGRAILKDDQLWYHAKLGCHSVEVYVRFAEPDEGGMIRIRYSEGGSDNGNQLRLAYVAEVLRLLGASAEVKGGQFLNCSWDKDHGLASRSQIERALPLFPKALKPTGNLDWAFQGIEALFGAEQAKQMALAMAATLVAQGNVPFFVHVNGSRTPALMDSYRQYQQAEDYRTRVRNALNRELRRLDLPEFPEGRAFGQETIDEHFTRPWRLALARGELVIDGNGVPQRGAGYDPLASLARAVLADEEAALRTAATLAQTQTESAARQDIGAVGRMPAESLQWLWGDGEGLTAWVLRDNHTQTPAYAAAMHWDGRVLRAIDADAMAELLNRKGTPASAGLVPGRIQRQRWRRLLARTPAEPTTAISARGLAASAGKGSFATGRVFFREPTAPQEGVFIAPYTTPDDLETMRRCAAVVTTGGGLLSHAGITTRELGIPAVILHHARWSSEDGKPVLDVDAFPPAAAIQGPGGLWLTLRTRGRSLRIREGDVLRVDGRLGAVAGFDDGVRAPLREAQGLLMEWRAGRGDPAALAAWLGQLRGPPRTAAAEFLLEEALWNQALAGHGQAILSALFGLPDIRADLRAHGERLLDENLGPLAETLETDGGEVAQTEAADVAARLARLRALAETLDLDQSRLKELEARLEDWRRTRQVLWRGAWESLNAAAERWSGLLAQGRDLAASSLPDVKRLLRSARRLLGRGPRKIAFVCTGNTCRSPLAEYLAKDMLGQEGAEIISRGISAGEAPMSEGSMRVLAERGIDGGGHRSRMLSADDVAGSELILAMSRSHLDYILSKYPEAEGKTFLLKDYAQAGGGDVADPFHQPVETYRRVADEIAAALATLFPGGKSLAELQAAAQRAARRKRARLLASPPSVLPLDQVDDDLAELVGGKSAKLGEIMSVVQREGGTVPGGSAVTTEAYLRFLRENDLEEPVMRTARELDGLLSAGGLGAEQVREVVETASRKLQGLILSGRLDAEDGVGKDILDSIDAQGLRQARFAVRSSAVQEDREEAAFAGAAESHLYVDRANLLRKVVETWASFWLPRGIQYRWQQGIRSVELRPAVAVQQMADAQASGVMFTADPVTGRPDVVINAAYGLGEGIVSGQVQADQYRADRRGEEISAPVLGGKKTQVVRADDGLGTRIRPVPAREQRRRALSPAEVRDLARIGAALEEHFGYPLDVEFAVADDRLVILQARAITSARARD
ncbi:MAG: PEP/pyruvate-binding domain-containing protein, partial [Elusimicrobia bacterium]|nr:PEP/pyruvate-binding domain-containing protein [Elusimicrobiota bacterium]